MDNDKGRRINSSLLVKLFESYWDKSSKRWGLL